MKHCAECGREWDDAFQYCPQDGSRLRLSQPDLEVGRVVAGKYEILGSLGRGAHGTVYRARHRFAGGLRAVKILDPALTGDESHLRRVQAAAAAWAGLRSPYTVRLYDLDFADDAGYFLVEELIEGESLEKLVADRGRLPSAVCAALLRQISESLAEAHAAGVSHGQLTATNILLTGNFPGFSAKVTDFGLEAAASIAQDNFRLGALLIRMLSGKQVGKGASAQEACHALQSVQAPADLVSAALGLLGLPGQEPARPAIGAVTPIQTRVAQPPAPSAVAYSITGEEVGGPASEPDDAEPTFTTFEERGLSARVRIVLLVLVTFLLAGLLVWLLREGPGLTNRAAPSPAPEAEAMATGPSFDYEAVHIPGEGEPPQHAHVFVQIEGVPLYIIRDQSGYASTLERAQAVTEALRRATDNLRRKPPPHLALADVDHGRAIVEQDLPEGGQLTIVTVTAADVAGYNARSPHKLKQEDLAQWWLARTADYLAVFALGEAPRLTTGTGDGAALARLAESVQRQSGGKPKPATRQDVDRLDPSLREALQAGVLHWPGAEPGGAAAHGKHSGPASARKKP